jgi:Domain of unknown function (DUF5615)
VKVRLYFDEDSMDRALLRALAARGVDVESALTCGMIERPDEDHLSFAAQEGRALFSFNVGHFTRLHSEWLAAGRSHAGVIVGQQRRHSVGEQLRRLLRLRATLPAEEMRDRLEFLGSWGG